MRTQNSSVSSRAAIVERVRTPISTQTANR